MKLMKLAAIAVLMFMGGAVFADEAYDVVDKFTHLDVPEFSKATMVLEITNKNGTTEIREITEYGSGFNVLRNVVFEIAKDTSKKYSGVRVLQAEKTNKEDDRWIYEPSLRNVRRIQTGERSGSFMGSEYSYNDMTTRKADEDKHEMLDANASVNINGTTYNCWKIRSDPKKKNDIEFSYRICWYDKKTILPVKMEYYDKKDPNTLMKTYLIEKIDNVNGITGTSYVLRRTASVTNHITGRKTRVTVKNFIFDDERIVNKKIFTTNWLMTGK